MALTEQRITSNGIEIYDKVKVAIDRLKAFEPENGYWVGDSGGKDSCVATTLCKMAGVKHQSHYSLTTVDPPKLVKFIKEFHTDTIIDFPKESMWKLIERKGFPPTRMIRYCCDELKESCGKGNVIVTGVRWAESVKRKANRHLVDIGKGSSRINYNDDNDESRKQVENCYRKSTTTVNPIIDWEDEDVWEFIKKYNVPYCKLYDEGYKRLGCIGCPLSSNQKKELEEYPSYKKAYLTALGKMLETRKRKGLGCDNQFSSVQSCYDWWIGESGKEEETFDGQIEIGEE